MCFHPLSSKFVEEYCISLYHIKTATLCLVFKNILCFCDTMILFLPKYIDLAPVRENNFSVIQKI